MPRRGPLHGQDAPGVLHAGGGGPLMQLTIILLDGRRVSGEYTYQETLSQIACARRTGKMADFKLEVSHHG